MTLAELLKDTTATDQVNVAIFGVVALVVVAVVIAWVMFTVWREGE